MPPNADNNDTDEEGEVRGGGAPSADEREARGGAAPDVVVSPDGQWIATTGDDRTTRVWDSVTGAQVYQIPLTSSGAELAFSNDGKYLVSTDQRGKVNIWDMSTLGARRDSIQFNGMLSEIQYSPSGDRLAVAGRNGVWLLNLDSTTDTISRPSDSPTLPFKSSVDNIAFSPDAKYLGISTEGKEIALYDSSRTACCPRAPGPAC